MINEGAATAHNGPTDADHLHGDHVVGEDVRGIHRFAAALLPPAQEAKGEDEDGEREEEQDVGDREGGEDGGARCGVEAAVEEEVVCGVGGGVVRRREGDIWGGRGVDGHFHVPEGEERNTKEDKLLRFNINNGFIY